LFSSESKTIDVNNEILRDVSTILTSETASRIERFLSNDPLSKERLSQPLFAEVMAIYANKYGWESGVQVDNRDKVRSELQINETSLARFLKILTRKNPIQIIKDVISGNLNNGISKAIMAQTTADSNKIETTWEFPPEALSNDDEVRKWLFRRG
jgi:hypothetical protein